MKEPPENLSLLKRLGVSTEPVPPTQSAAHAVQSDAKQGAASVIVKPLSSKSPTEQEGVRNLRLEWSEQDTYLSSGADFNKN